MCASLYLIFWCHIQHTLYPLFWAFGPEFHWFPDPAMESVVSPPVDPASLGTLLESRLLGVTPDLLNQNLIIFRSQETCIPIKV